MSDTITFRSQATFDLCETLLMPGGKARVSPYLMGLAPVQERFLIPVYQSVALDLLRSGYLPDDLSLLDYDSPFAIGASVMIDTLLAWQTACALYNIPTALSSFRMRVHNNLERGDAWKSNLQTLFGRIRERAQQLPELTLDWLFDSRGSSSQEANLVLVKFPWQKNEELARVLDTLPAGGIVAAIAWQGNDVHPAQLFSWRHQLLRERTDFVALGPCGQEYGRMLPAVCQICSHGQRAQLHILHNGKGELLDDLPAWSYVLLIKQTTPIERPEHPLLATTDLVAAETKSLHVRYIGAVRQRVVVDEHPDTFEDNPTREQWREYLKLCPGHTDIQHFAIEERAGMQKPRLRYGQWLHIDRARPHRSSSDPTSLCVLALPNEATLHQVPGLSVAETFLPTYTAKTRAAIDEAAYRLFGFSTMYEFQHIILERVLCGGDIFAIAATGGGKSECYILPAMLLPGITVVVSPLKSLMQDQYDQRIRDRYGLDYLTTSINGDVPFYERQGRLRRLILGHFKLLYVTPEQLERGYVLDALRQANQTVGVRYLAMDEAHCISQWGHDFRPSYLNIVERLQNYELYPRRIALTATASPRVRDDVCQELRLRPQNLSAGGDVFIHTANRPELNLVVRRTRSTEEKAQIIVDELRRLGDGSAIVFMPHTGGKPEQPQDLKPPASAPHPDNAGMVSPGVSPFARYLEKQLGSPVAIYHGAMDDNRENVTTGTSGGDSDQDDVVLTRREEQERFMKGEKQVMVATKGFGMGIDKPDIRLVIHRSPTANLEAYAQEAGRAGRDGKLATVLLLFSEDRPRIIKMSPDDFLPRDTLQSDREIQSFFTDQRYVRQIDVEALIAFMRTKYPRRVNDTLYFTNDQVMAMLDACEQQPDLLELSQPYRWPQFPPRSSWSYESPEHKRILDQGHIYRAKREYIGRVLKVLYNNRPTLNGQVVPLIRAAHETGLILRDFRIYAPERIINSSVYFGARLRYEAVSAQELQLLLPNGDQVDLMRLASRLGLSLRETASMLYDIRSCEGRTDRYGRWMGTLLNYKRLEAPRWVSLPATYTAAAWRDYAGAYTRGKGGERKTLDDYFPDWTLNKPTGWEITPGNGLNYPDRRAYLDAFMQLHDERQDNDQSNFAYLVDRYIGADGNSKECLRSLLLGYLKTGEVIEGGNCLGCSVCVPNLDFERYSVVDRERVVRHLMVDTLTWLDQLEACNRQPPSVEIWQGVLAAIAQENAQGRSGSAYLDSWLARVIQDDPEHQGALWLRLHAFEQNMLTVAPADIVTALTRLAPVTQSMALLDDLRRLASRCLEAREYTAHRSTLLRLAAQLAGRCGAWGEEAALWQQVLAESGPKGQDDLEILTQLLELYRRADRVNDVAQAADIAQRLIQRPTLPPATAQLAYGMLVKNWTWEQLEIALNSHYAHPAIALLTWPGLTTVSGRQAVVNWLAQNSLAIQPWPTTTLYDLAQHLQPELDHTPGALLSLAERSLTNADKTTADLLLRAWLAGEILSNTHLQALAANFLELDASTTAKRLTSKANAVTLLSALWQTPDKPDFPLRWLAYFPAGTLRQLPEEIFASVWTALLDFRAIVDDSILDDLVVRLDAIANTDTSYLKQITTERPDLALRLFQVALQRADIPKTTMLKALFPALLSDTIDVQQAILYLNALSKNQSLYQDDPCMAACLDVWQALQTDHVTWPHLRLRRVDSDVLVKIAQKWLSYEDKPHRLDMLVIILQDVCSRSPATWMTPISLEFQALCAAGRFNEAQVIVAYNPSLRVQGRDITAYLKEAHARRTPRSPEYKTELQRLWVLANTIQ